MRRAVGHSEVDLGESEEGQQGNHYINQAQREQEREQEFTQLEKKDTV